MGNGRSWIAALVAATMVTLSSSDAEASGLQGIENCFRESQAFAMCNGFLAGLGGLGGMAAPIVALVDPEENGGLIAVGVIAGLYSGASGAALIASSQAQDPAKSSTRTSGTVLGIVDLAAGGSALVLSAVAGVAMGVGGDGDDDDLGFVFGPGVAGVTGPAPGLTIGGRF